MSMESMPLGVCATRTVDRAFLRLRSPLDADRFIAREREACRREAFERLSQTISNDTPVVIEVIDEIGHCVTSDFGIEPNIGIRVDIRMTPVATRHLVLPKVIGFEDMKLRPLLGSACREVRQRVIRGLKFWRWGK